MDEKRSEVQQVIASLSPIRQRLLVLLIGTFKAIATSESGMSSEALGVSVSPSVLHCCVGDEARDGKSMPSKVDDVTRFKVCY